MRWKLDDLLVFRAVGEASSITGAAQRLGMAKSTVSAVLQRLEADLGVRLVERSVRQVRMTAEGERVLAHALQIMDQAAEVDALVGGLRATPEGRVSLAAPSAFCREFLAPRLPEFTRRWPAVHLEVAVTARALNLFEDAFDLAVVVGSQADSELTRKLLLAGRLCWVASPAYAEENAAALRLATVADLASHVQVCETRYTAAPLALHIAGERGVFAPTPAVWVNDPLSVRAALKAGMGVSCLPWRYCRAQIAAGLLVEVMPHIEIDAAASQLAVIFPGKRLQSPRCRAVIEFLDEICRPFRDEG